MATLEARLLVLSAVSLFQPVNGYQIRRELLSWGSDDWAHLNPGSIYTVLGTLTRRGLVTRHEVPEGQRTVAVYSITPEGRAELEQLMTTALETVEPMNPLAFSTALCLGNLLTRERFVAALTRRLERIAGVQSRMETPLSDDAVPPHVARVAHLWAATAAVEREWLERTLTAVIAGDLHFAGEDAAWMPPPDDPGWQMETDRRRYRELLGDALPVEARTDGPSPP